ncbi:FtsK/SpoIIIE domain-containing protein [Bacillus sp. AFS017336]|uniref:FtsK/SpoIIIE domain-containing protein n=1 Tax=Bacillus sp. AFS017336 TaxID=2033489 RepID=UPI000BF243B4|nr:FtsK/SpoIIIE domain-containing protein [Bacillus sp. AFS017336]PEL06731.1 chromosome partitioning protein ParA [Bacillus sp. AFS017336]
MEKEKGTPSMPKRVALYTWKMIKKYSEYLKELESKKLFEAKIKECFELGEMFRKYGDVQVYPQIVRVGLLENGIEAVLNLPRGFDPGDLAKKAYVFEQEFGTNVHLKKVSSKTFVLYVYVNNPLKEKYNYNYSSIESNLKYNLPIYIGRDISGNVISYDMVEEPNLLIAGEPGSGKSVLLRSILTTLIFNKTPEELKLYLFDLKKSEFFIFDDVPHVIENTHENRIIEKRFYELVNELKERGELLKKNRVPHINRLPKKVKPPYIVVCIDEYSLIEGKGTIKAIKQIAAIGRALGVYLILSTQRPDSDVLEGIIKALLTVRIGGRQQDATNSKIIIDTKGCEEIKIKGHMKMKSTIGLIDVKVPLLNEVIAEEMLDPLRVEKPVIEELEPTEEAKPSKKQAKKGKEKKAIVWGVLK